MARVLLDSSVWVSYLTHEDVHHRQAVELMQKYWTPQTTILLPDLILNEIVNVSYRIKPDLTYVNQLHAEIKRLQPNVRVMSGGAEFWLEYAPHNIIRFGLKTADALICCYAAFYRVNIFHSFDKSLQRKASALLS